MKSKLNKQIALLEKLTGKRVKLVEGISRVTIDQMNEILSKVNPQEKVALYMITTVSMNKNIVDENGNKVPNPFFDKVKKKNIVYGRVNYNYGEEFKSATGNDHVPTGRSMGEKQGAIVVNEKGARLPLTDVEYDTPSFEVNGNEITKEELKPYLKPVTPSAEGAPTGVKMIAPYLANVKKIVVNNTEYQII